MSDTDTTPDPTKTDPPPDPPKGDPPADRTFTQAEIDTVVAERLARDRRERKAKEDRDKLDETDRLKAEKEDAVKAADERIALATQRVVRTEVRVAAIGAGIRADRLDAFTAMVPIEQIPTNDDGEPDSAKLNALVTATVDRFPEWKAAPQKGGSEIQGGTPPTLTRDEISKMSVEEITARREEVEAALKAGI